MKALSVRAPWWWYILECGKDIENRDWTTNYRGRVLLHASKWWGQSDIEWDVECAREMRSNMTDREPVRKGITLPQMRGLGGHIIGSVEIVDCVTESSSPWFVGKFGFVLKSPAALFRPVPFKGALGFFNVPDSVIEGK